MYFHEAVISLGKDWLWQRRLYSLVAFASSLELKHESINVFICLVCSWVLFFLRTNAKTTAATTTTKRNPVAYCSRGFSLNAFCWLWESLVRLAVTIINLISKEHDSYNLCMLIVWKTIRDVFFLHSFTLSLTMSFSSFLFICGKSCDSSFRLLHRQNGMPTDMNKRMPRIVLRTNIREYVCGCAL